MADGCSPTATPCFCWITTPGGQLQEWKGVDVAAFSPDGKQVVVSSIADSAAVRHRARGCHQRAQLGAVTFDNIVHREVAFADGGRRIVALDWFGDGWKVWDASIAKDRLIEREPGKPGFRVNVLAIAALPPE